MARTTVKQAQSPNFDAAFGDEFTVKNYSEKEWDAVYYAIRELQGRALRKSKTANGESFSWDAYKAKFAEVFGTPQDKRYTLEQMLSYGLQKWGMNLEELKAYNQRSWDNRNSKSVVASKDSSEWEIPTSFDIPSEWKVPNAKPASQTPISCQTDDIPY